MLATRSSLATALLVAVGSLGGVASKAAEQTPEELLASRGLKRSGVLFILESETEFVPKATKLLPEYRQLKGLYDKLATAMQIQAECDVLDDQLKSSTKARVSLGPSPDYKKASAWLINAVRSTSPESLKPKVRKKSSRNTISGKNTAKGKEATSGAKRPNNSAKKGTGDNDPAASEPVASPK
jgi:hypothetical protein